MKRVSLVLLFLVQLSLTGCAYYHALDSNLPHQIDVWVEQQEYGLALQTLGFIKPSHRNYDLLIEKREAILLLAKQLERTTIQQTDSLIGKSEWHQAHLLFESSLNKLPLSSSLNKAYNAFVSKRTNYLNKLELKLMVNKGEWLGKNEEIRKEIARVIPNSSQARRALRRHNDDVNEISMELAECGENAINKENTELAEQCLKLTKNIKPPAGIQTRLTAVQKAIKAEKKAQIRRHNKKIRALLAQLKQGYSHENLQLARQYFLSLENQDKRNPQASALRQELKNRIADGMAESIEAGRKLYSDGRIKQALEVWLVLQPLDPDNQELNGHIDRAQRVLKKIRMLSEKPNAANHNN